MSRPSLNKDLEPKVFLNYYYLKEELIVFCKQQGIVYFGSKQDLTERIRRFLETGKKSSETNIYRRKPSCKIDEITPESVIEKNFVCTEKHRDFFKSIIGNKFKFNVEFQKYLKESAGQAYSEAVNEWYRIQKNKKANKGKNPIDKQFEYNTYIRDFFNDNRSLSLKDAIDCWKYKKSLPGHNSYEKDDLKAMRAMSANPN